MFYSYGKDAGYGVLKQGFFLLEAYQSLQKNIKNPPQKNCQNPIHDCIFDLRILPFLLVLLKREETTVMKSIRILIIKIY